MKSNKNKLINSLLKITLASGLIVTTGALVLKNGEETAFENINIFNQRSEFAKIAAPTEFIYDSNTNTWSAAGSLGADYSTGSVEIVSGAEAGSEIVCETNAGITTYTISGLLYGKAYDSINLHYSVPEVSEEDIVIDPFTITETPPTISSWDYDKENSFDAIELTVNFVENSNSQIIETDVDINGSKIIGTETTDGTFVYSITGLDSNSSYDATLSYDWGWGDASETATLSTNPVDEITNVNIISIEPDQVQGYFTYEVNDGEVATFTASAGGNTLDIIAELTPSDTYFTIYGLTEGTEYTGSNNIVIAGNDAEVNLPDFTTPFHPKFEFSEVTPDYESATFTATLTNPSEPGYDISSFEFVVKKNGYEYRDFTVSGSGFEWTIQINELDSNTTYSNFTVEVNYKLDTTIPNYSTEEFTSPTTTLNFTTVKRVDVIENVVISNVYTDAVEGTFDYRKNDRESDVNFVAKDSSEKTYDIDFSKDGTKTTKGETELETYSFKISGLEQGVIYSDLAIYGEDAIGALGSFETPKEATFTFTPDPSFYDIRYNILLNDVSALDYYNSSSFKLFNDETDMLLNDYVTVGAPGNWTISLPETDTLESSTEYELPELRIEYDFNATDTFGNNYTSETQVVNSGDLGSVSTLSSDEVISIDEFLIAFVPGTFEDNIDGSTLNVSFDVVIPVIEEVVSTTYNFTTLPEVVRLNVKSYSVYDGSELSDEEYTIDLYNHREGGVKHDNSSIDSSKVESYDETNRTITYKYNEDFLITDQLKNNRKYEFDLEVISTNKKDSELKAEFSLETDPIGYSELPSSAFFNIEAISKEEIIFSYNYMVDHHGTDYTKPEAVRVEVSQSNQIEENKNRASKEITIQTPELSGRLNIANELNGFVIDEESEFSFEILGINIGGTQFGADSIINTPIINVVMPQLTYYDIHKLIWLIILIVIAIAATTGSLVYIEWPKNEEEIREKINRDELTPEGIANKYELSLTEHSALINKVLQVEKDVKNIRLLAVAARADAAKEKRKTEEQRELEAREKVKKSVIPSVDFIHENVELGRKEISVDEELKSKLDGWLVAFDGITENMVRDIGVTMINPEPGNDFNDEEHIKVGEISGQAVKLGSVALVNKVGFKTDEGLIRKAEVTIAIYALPNQNENKEIQGREV